MFTKHESTFAETFNYAPLWGTRYSINLDHLTVDWIEYRIIRKLGYYCHNSLPINNCLHPRKRQCKHDQDLITWPTHIHTVYLIRSDVQRKAGGEESGYQFRRMQMISADSPGWWDATTQQPDWIPLIMTKQSITAAEHVLSFSPQTKPTAKYFRGVNLSKKYSPSWWNFKWVR